MAKKNKIINERKHNYEMIQADIREKNISLSQPTIALL